MRVSLEVGEPALDHGDLQRLALAVGDAAPRETMDVREEQREASERQQVTSSTRALAAPATSIAIGGATRDATDGIS